MLTHRAMRLRAQRRQRGLTLVELMVGIAVGLFVVAAASMLVSTQLNDNRHLLLETQLQQDLRAAADIITRELRRAGHWQAAQQALATAAAPAVANPHTALMRSVDQAVVDGEPTGEVRYQLNSSTGVTGPFGFKHEGHALKTLLAGAGWQELTDPNTLRVTAFSVTPRFGPAMRLPCPHLCADGTADCWPTTTVRELVVDIEGQSAVDPAVQRSLRTVVRLRNDWVRFDPGLGGQACPAA